MSYWEVITIQMGLACKRFKKFKMLHISYWFHSKCEMSLRLWRRFLHEAYSGSSFPEEPQAHQRHLEWGRGAWCSLSGYHRSHAGPQTSSPVPHGASGRLGMLKTQRQNARLLDTWLNHCSWILFVCLFLNRESLKQSFFKSRTDIRRRRGGS